MRWGEILTELIQEKAISDEEIHDGISREGIMSEIQDTPLIEEEKSPVEAEQGVFHSLRIIFTNRNYAVFLVTGWMFNCYNHFSSYLNLYLKVIGWNLITIGVVMSIVSAFSSIARLVGGYIGDVANRKGIAVAAYLILGIYYVYVGLFVDFWLIFIGLMIYSVHDLFRSGSSSYIMENVPKDHSGFALSLFTAGRVFSVFGLLLFGFLEPILGFPEAFRFIYFITGLSLIIASVIRAIFLESPKREIQGNDKTNLSNFVSENVRAVKLLLLAIPGLMFVVVLDTLSDSFFSFAALIYTYEELSVDIAGINVILLSQLVISFPLLLKMGRVSDRKGVKKAAVIVYSIMPVSAAFIFIAPVIPSIVPSSVASSMESFIPGIGIFFSTPFIAIVMKYVNDALWWTLIIILIRKRLPKTDTSKILSIFWVTVYVFSSIGPAIASVIYTFMTPPILFLTIIILNLVILVAIVKGPFGNDSKATDTFELLDS